MLDINRLANIQKKTFLGVIYTLVWVLIFGGLQSCASLHSNNSVKGFYQESQIDESLFLHRTLYVESSKSNDRLYVFIEGDGIPWIDNKHIAKDPSPKSPLLLDFMRQYSGNRLYLGRPCYFETNDPLCHFKYWTSHRYSERVVRSMVMLVKNKLDEKNFEQLTLIGHSGGGTLARLMSCHFERPVKLVTLGANLDTDAWVKHYDWTPLFGSLNPARDTRNCRNLDETHIHGDADKIVPYHLNQKYFDLYGLQPHILKTQNHTDWSGFWPDLWFPEQSLHPRCRLWQPTGWTRYWSGYSQCGSNGWIPNPIQTAER